MTLEYVVNGDIRSREVRLIGINGEQIGVVPVNEALRMARDAGLDLLQVADKATPPVCKILDFGKFKYEQSKKEKSIAKQQRASQVETKEIQLRPVTDDHDLDIKGRRIVEFLGEGHKVKITVKFHGREITHAEMGYALLNKLFAKIGEHKVERAPATNERNIITIIAPVTKK